MKLDFLELDTIEAAAAVAHAASSQLYGMLNEMDGADWAGTGLEGDALATEIYGMACYTASKQAGGEQLWIQCRMRGMINDGMPESRAFADVEQSRKWAFLLFCETFKPLLDKLATERGLREEMRLAEGRKAPAAPKIEDTIFEPIGSMGEMEPHALDFLKNLSKPKAPAPEMPPAIVEHEDGAQMQPINLGAPSEEETANQQPQAGTNTEPQAGRAPQGAPVVPGDGDTPPAGDGNGQQGAPDGAAGGAGKTVKTPPTTRKTAAKGKSRRKAPRN
ncbi:hypothetical protein [uncultured Martelella sp.]|uniref:hypothetical protein n=1 Tax=uncultured Martelella sp. TaxID=392331 RepID=UPI0029C7CE85|nr:hypothetical protein [uncultured Martelella sp.]